jgi:hypothetical protein
MDESVNLLSIDAILFSGSGYSGPSPVILSAGGMISFPVYRLSDCLLVVCTFGFTSAMGSQIAACISPHIYGWSTPVSPLFMDTPLFNCNWRSVYASLTSFLTEQRMQNSMSRKSIPHSS